MSTLESVIWHVLGYIAIPSILIGGFLAAALVFYWLVRLLNKDGLEQ
jgi:uncharacterized protein (TIGR02808 family)